MLWKVLLISLVVTATIHRTDAVEDPCEQPKDVGPCDGIFPRWFFNSLTGECEQFDYGGCDGNSNNFQTLEECEDSCVDPCQQTKKVGPCEAIIPRWYYNSLTGQCELFDWGGCDPNDNNFATLKECRKTCVRKNKHGRQ